MSSRQKKIVGLISLLLTIILLLLVLVIVRKIKFPRLSISPIQKESIISSPSATLKYYYELKPNSVIKTDIKGLESVQTINADGINSDKNYQIPKPKNTFRILALGDSFTFGLYVNTKDSWPSLLENMLNTNLKCSNIDKFEVINLGVSGYDTQYEVAHFIEKGQKYNPDMVIWYFVDVLRMDEQSKDYLNQIKPSDTPSPDNGSVARKNEIDSNVETAVTKKLGIQNILDFQSNQIAKFRERFNGKTLITFRPTLNDPIVDINFLKGETKKYNLTYVDNLRDYYKMDGSFLNAPVNPNAHPNQKGHQIIAEDLFNYLKNSNAISCQK